MANFKKKTTVTAEISTSALPDIIFILLFFFMVTTKMKKNDLLVKTRLPKVTQVQKLEQKNAVTVIYIGKPSKAELFGTEPKVQVNDAFISPKEIPQFIEQERVKLGDKAGLMTVLLKIDEEAKMGLVTDVKQQLRQADARKIMFNTSKRMEIN